jgi:integrase
MAHALKRLTALKVPRLKKPGLYADGGGLYLQISGTGARSWIFRYRMGGRKTPRDMGLGSLDTVSLSEAREKAVEQRRFIDQGIDPIGARKVARSARALDDAKAMTFKACATAYIDAHKAGWRNAKHADQWTATLKTYAYPKFAKLPVAAIDVGLVLKVLEPIWKSKTETASRVRGRIEQILDWAKTRGFRAGDNPARWRGNLQNLLPKRTKVQKVKHHAALPYPEIGAFMQKLREREGVAARALEFLILTTARTSEVTRADWSEIDLKGKVWTVPPDKIKGEKEHRVPLSAPTIALLKRIKKEYEADDFVFPGGKVGKPLSSGGMMSVLKRMGRDDLTVHGFRSTFRDWAAEQTSYPNEVCEMALAHVVGDKTEAAYRRGDLLKKRERLMVDWAAYCGKVLHGAKVIPINRRRAKH